MAIPDLSQDAIHLRGGPVRHGFGVHRGQPGWEIDWDGFKVLAYGAEAARRGINEVTEDMANDARTMHPWENRTGQTESAIYQKDAELEVVGWTPASTPHVWGQWGVQDRPRFRYVSVGGRPDRDPATGRFVSRDQPGALVPTDIEESVSTVDVAMFLEFGTIRADPFPFLYPAWDANKHRLSGIVARIYRELAAMNWRPGMGTGGFASFKAYFERQFWKV